MAKIKTQEITSVGEDAEKEEPSPAVLVEMQAGAATVENMWRFLKRLKIQLPEDPVIPLLGIYAKKGKPQFEKRHAPLCL